ncbi:MAG: hypothetical protein WA609_16340, partial [Terriglobales bacterium]
MLLTVASAWTQTDSQQSSTEKIQPNNQPQNAAPQGSSPQSSQPQPQPQSQPPSAGEGARATQTPATQAPATPAPEKIISPQEAKELFRSVDELLKFASEDTGLPIKHEVKRKLADRQEVESYLEKGMK